LPWVLVEVLRRWGQTIPSMAWVTGDMAARLVDGQRARDF
jgi:hypothetical protein